jgi:hypothetical protein
MARKHPRKANPPIMPSMPTMTQHAASEMKALQGELKERQLEALRLYRPTPKQDEIHRCKASEILVIGGNRSGKSLCTFVEDARAVCGEDPYNKYPKTDGVLVIVGKDWRHIGMVVYPLLFNSGAFKIIKDLQTGEWRPFNPSTDEARRSEAKASPPLIPKRLVKSKSWVLKSAQYIQTCVLHTGWTIFFFSSEGDPVQGFSCDRAHIDEDINNENWVPELQARLVDRKGCFAWSAMPHSTNNALLGLKERAEEQEEIHGDESTIRQFKLRFLDNPHLDEKEKKKSLARWSAVGLDTVRQRAEGEFITDSVLMYPSFSMQVHGYERSGLENGQIPADWTRYAVIDPGHSVTAILFAAVPPDEKFFLLYDQLYLRQCNAKIFGEEFEKKVKDTHFHSFIIDAHGARLRDIGSGRLPSEQYTEQLVQRNIRSQVTGASFLAGCDDIPARSEATRVAMHIRPDGTTQLRVLSAAVPDLERELKRYRKKVNYVSGVPVVTDAPNTRGECHLAQCLEYLCAYRPKYHKPPVKSDEKEPWWVKWMERRKKQRLGAEGGSYVNLGPTYEES